LKDKAFSTFLDQNLPFELRPAMGISSANGPLIDNANKRLAKRIAVAPLSLFASSWAIRSGLVEALAQPRGP
jgi:hypothetical protein